MSLTCETPDSNIPANAKNRRVEIETHKHNILTNLDSIWVRGTLLCIRETFISNVHVVGVYAECADPELCLFACKSEDLLQAYKALESYTSDEGNHAKINGAMWIRRGARRYDYENTDTSDITTKEKERELTNEEKNKILDIKIHGKHKMEKLIPEHSLCFIRQMCFLGPDEYQAPGIKWKSGDYILRLYKQGTRFTKLLYSNSGPDLKELWQRFEQWLEDPHSHCGIGRDYVDRTRSSGLSGQMDGCDDFLTISSSDDEPESTDTSHRPLSGVTAVDEDPILELKAILKNLALRTHVCEVPPPSPSDDSYESSDLATSGSNVSSASSIYSVDMTCEDQDELESKVLGVPALVGDESESEIGGVDAVTYCNSGWLSHNGVLEYRELCGVS